MLRQHLPLPGGCPALPRRAPGRRPSIAGYDGRLWATFLPLDLDAHPTNTETLALLRAWVGRQSRPLPDAEIASVVASAYARPYPYTYGCHDEMIRSFCPYAGRLFDCADYREQHPRSGRAVAT